MSGAATHYFVCGRPVDQVVMVPAASYDDLCAIIRTLGVDPKEIVDLERDLGREAAHILARVLAGDGAREILRSDKACP